MRIDKISIQNWRSIKDLDVYPQDITALIGPNNAGKTNILSALNFLLGEKWPSMNTLADGDFYNHDRANHVSISVWFVNGPENVNRIWFSSSDGRAWYSYQGSDNRYPLNQARREQFPLVYLDAARSYESTFSTSQWSLFGRIIRLLDKHFRDNEPPESLEKVSVLLSQAQDILRTDLYTSFETSIVEAFADQVRMTSHKVEFNFQTFDPLNFYKTLHPILIEHSIRKSPAEVGSGMRNLIDLALFRAYAEVVKEGAIIAIEEPEIYLHPHAQRSLASLFEEIASAGNQIFYSTHSGAFVNVSRTDRIVLVERCPDEDEETCTQVKSTSSAQLLGKRQALHPSVPMTVPVMQERFRLLCGSEHAEAFFARCVVIVEGPTEVAALPIYAEALGVNLNAMGISIVSAGGKNNIDSLYHLYKAHGILTYVIFDNDKSKSATERASNRVLTRMLGLPETDLPTAFITDEYAILEGDFETSMKSQLDDMSEGTYQHYRSAAANDYGGSKPLIAKVMAQQLISNGIVPPFIRAIFDEVRYLCES